MVFVAAFIVLACLFIGIAADNFVKLALFCAWAFMAIVTGGSIILSVGRLLLA